MFILTQNLKLKTHFEITDTTNLNVSSRCLSLQCGAGSKFLNNACKTSLVPICSSLGKMIYSLIFKWDTFFNMYLATNFISILIWIFVHCVCAHVIRFGFSFYLNINKQITFYTCEIVLKISSAFWISVRSLF